MRAAELVAGLTQAVILSILLVLLVQVVAELQVLVQQTLVVVEVVLGH
jgi:hypothetical protein